MYSKCYLRDPVCWWGPRYPPTFIVEGIDENSWFGTWGFATVMSHESHLGLGSFRRCMLCHWQCQCCANQRKHVPYSKSHHDDQCHRNLYEFLKTKSKWEWWWRLTWCKLHPRYPKICLLPRHIQLVPTPVGPPLITSESIEPCQFHNAAEQPVASTQRKLNINSNQWTDAMEEKTREHENLLWQSIYLYLCLCHSPFGTGG